MSAELLLARLAHVQATLQRSATVWVSVRWEAGAVILRGAMLRVRGEPGQAEWLLCGETAQGYRSYAVTAIEAVGPEEVRSWL